MTNSEPKNPRFFWRLWLPIILVLLILPTFYTAPHIILKPENPEGDIDYPSNIESESEGLVLIVLDGVGDDYLLSDNYMPKLNKYRENSAILNVRTGPLTLSATCVSEMMTGVPNSPIDGLRNFDLSHPGGNDPWLAASNDDRYDVAMVGSYVMGNIYKQVDGINFTNTFKGHSDYCEGDEETFEIRDTHSVPLKEARENFEKEYLTTQLKKFGGNISKTAKFVGMERSALHRKLKLLGVKDLN